MKINICRSFSWLFTALTVCLLMCVGCSDQGDPQSTAATENTEQTDQATASGPVEIVNYKIALSHIHVTYAGCDGCPPEITRLRDEAHDMVRQASALVRGGRDFGSVAREFSDDPLVEQNGGYLGVLQHRDLIFGLEVTAAKLEVGQISYVVETPAGFHILKREPVRQCHAFHLLIAWKEARKAAATVTRNQQQALELVNEVRRKAQAEGADLCKLVRHYSDDAKNRAVCGSLGDIEPGLLPAHVDSVVFGLEPDEISDVIETIYGYHIFWRE